LLKRLRYISKWFLTFTVKFYFCDSKYISLANPSNVLSAAIASSTSLLIVSIVSSKLLVAFAYPSTITDKFSTHNLFVPITIGSDVSFFVYITKAGRLPVSNG
jgi:hypothetical protein